MGEFDKLSLLADIQLAASANTVTALGTGRIRTRCIEFFNPAHMTARAANGPVLSERLLPIADGDLLNFKLAAMSVERIAWGQFLEGRGGIAVNLDGWIFLLRMTVLVVDSAIKSYPPFRKGVIGQQAVVGKKFQGRCSAKAVATGPDDAQFTLDFHVGFFFLRVQFVELVV